MIKHIFLFLLFLFGNCSAWAQTNTQLWTEYLLTHPFANVWELEHLASYGTEFQSPRWSALKYNPTVAWSYSQHLDAVGGLTLQYTKQTETANSFEIRPMVGMRLHFTPNKRILTRAMLRYEFRNFQDLETKEWNSTGRTRVRMGALIPFNNPTMFNKDKLWYGIADAEWFFVVDEDVNERFANRFRLRGGIGYRIDYNSRIEFVYTLQESRNKLADNSGTRENIFRIRYRHFINKSTPSKTLGVGN